MAGLYDPSLTLGRPYVSEVPFGSNMQNCSSLYIALSPWLTFHVLLQVQQLQMQVARLSQEREDQSNRARMLQRLLTAHVQASSATEVGLGLLLP